MKVKSSTEPIDRDWIVVSLGILLYRIGILLLTRTSYHPDEYHQYQEPAVWLSGLFGESSDSLSWEWQQHYRIRSVASLLSCAIGYKLFYFMNLRNLQLWTVFPRLLHTFRAITGDLSLYAINRHLFPENPHIARWSIVFQLFSFFGTFCSARTLSNTIEMNTFSIATALFLRLFLTPKKHSLFRRLLLATASFLITQSVFTRATGLLLYGPMLAPCFFFSNSSTTSLFTSDHCWSRSEKIWFVRVTAWFVFVFVLIDSAVYGQFTIAPWRFVVVNVGQNVAVYFGSSPWHWPLTEGIPVVLGLYTPYLIYLGVNSQKEIWFRMPGFLKMWVFVSLSYAVLLRVVTAHQEHRFLLPILPALHSLLAFLTANTKKTASSVTVQDRLFHINIRQFVLCCVFFLHVVGSIYLLQYHQMGTEKAFQVVVQQTLSTSNHSSFTFRTMTQQVEEEERQVYLYLAAPCFSFPGYGQLSPAVSRGVRYVLRTPLNCSLPPWLDDANEARRDFASTILPESLTNFMNQMQIKSVKGTVRVFLVTFDAYEEVVRPIVATTATLVANVSHAFFRYDYDDPSPKYRVLVYEIIP